MKFSIERDVLIHLVTSSCGKPRGKKGKKLPLNLSACAARVFVTGPAMTSGHEALVFSDGQCELGALMFLEILKSYAAKPVLIIEVNDLGLHLEKSVVPISGFSRYVTPPENFTVYPVTDLHVLGHQT